VRAGLPTPFQIFVSYRREGTSAHAGRLYDFLTGGVDDHAGFGSDQVFMDIDTIQPGDDFREVIAEAVARCHVFLAVLGRQWATISDAQGDRRLDNPADYVRLEIEAALERKIPVIPILVDRADMPSATELPASLSAFAFRSAVELSDTRWRYDVGQLLSSLEKRQDELLNKRAEHSAHGAVADSGSASGDRSAPSELHGEKRRPATRRSAANHPVPPARHQLQTDASSPGLGAVWEGRLAARRDFVQRWSAELVVLRSRILRGEQLLTLASARYNDVGVLLAMTNRRILVVGSNSIVLWLPIRDVKTLTNLATTSRLAASSAAAVVAGIWNDGRLVSVPTSERGKIQISFEYHWPRREPIHMTDIVPAATVDEMIAGLVDWR
jgi:TIR domain